MVAARNPYVVARVQRSIGAQVQILPRPADLSLRVQARENSRAAGATAGAERRGRGTDAVAITAGASPCGLGRGPSNSAIRLGSGPKQAES